MGSSTTTVTSVRPVKAVYIHIPFCTNKCHYCDFNSYVLKGQPVDSYLQALALEIEGTLAETPANQIDTIFVGGGTPTVLTASQMEKFLQIVHQYFPVDRQSIEFTMEANPGTTERDKLAVMKQYGVNRISFGVQSFDADLLSRIGRIHSVDDVYRSIDHARQIGFTNLSIDLMFGLPQQTMQQLQYSLDAALALDLPHISIYGLKIEENTLFHTLYQKNELPLPTEDVEVDMYCRIMECLQAAGYEQYEISNFAKPGYASKHNTTYWKNEYYYGLGAGAHGYIHGQRHSNVKGVQAYIDACQVGLPVAEQFAVSREEAMEDFMMVGLRMLHGVSKKDFTRQFAESMDDRFAEAIHACLQRKWLERTNEGYRLTRAGLLLGNEVFARFV
jgi:putative oxygen-independent coproporphyrinogen III oxidase